MPTATRDAKQRFATVFNFLASTKNTPVDAVKLSAYYKELAGVDIEALEATGYALGGGAIAIPARRRHLENPGNSLCRGTTHPGTRAAGPVPRRRSGGGTGGTRRDY